jgi:protein O-GlcNAc transferase
MENVLNDENNKKIYDEMIGVIESGDVDVDKLLKKYDNHFLVYYFFGEYYSKLKKYELAKQMYIESIELNKKFNEGYMVLSILLFKYKQFNEALKYLEIGLVECPNDAKMLNFIGVILFMEYKKNKKKIFNVYKKMIELIGDKDKLEIFNKSPEIKQHLIIYKYFKIGCDALQTNARRQLIQQDFLNRDYLINDCYDNDHYNSINDILNVHNIKMNKYKHDIIRIGYVSGDFKNHVIAFFIEALLKYGDWSKFVVCCFSNTLKKDETSERLYNIGSYWVDIYGVSADIVRKQIKEMEIDVLIDLSGHTTGNRMDVFAERCAPVQITYLGFPNSTYLKTIDYRICDYISDPIDTKQYFSEKLLRMNRCFLCYTRDIEIKQVNRLFEDKIVFGVLNKHQKYSKEFIECVEQIINKVPNSILYLKSKNNIFNLPENKIKVIEYLDNDKYFDLFNEIDLCLDTFPYSGTTTTCDTLLTGTPVITYGIKDIHASNVSKSILHHMGCDELVSSSTDEFIDKSIQLALDRNRIINYKLTLKQKFLNVMNPIEFMEEFERILMTI